MAPSWAHLGAQVGAILVSKIVLESPQTISQTRSGARIRQDRFLCDLGPNLGPFWGQVGPILASKIAPEPPQTPPKTRSEARIRPDPQNGSKMMAPDRAAHSPCQGCSAEGLERVQNGGCHRRTCRSLALLPLNGLKRPLRLTAWKKRSGKV